MDLDDNYCCKTIFWDAITGLLYAALLYYANQLLHLAHTTPDACIVGQGTNAA